MRRRSSQSPAWGYLLPMQVHDGLPPFELRLGDVTLGPDKSCALQVEGSALGLAERGALVRIRRSASTGRVTLRSESGAVRVDARLLGRGREEQLQHGARIGLGVTGATYVFVDHTASTSFKAPNEILEKFLVGQRLGEGGFGQVFLLFDKKSNYKKKMAMKIVELSDEQERIFAKREAEILRSVKHPCVIQTYSVMRLGQQQFLLMEFLAGGDLSRFVNDKRPLNEAQTKLLFFQLALAMRYLHDKNVCHRDLKPANILLQHRDPYTIIKVTDFGLAKDEYLHSALTTVAGTELYLAPEVMTERTYTKQVDVWSMGVMLFYSLSGALPFPHGMSEAIRHHHQVMYQAERWSGVSVAALELVQRMLKVTAAQRPTFAQVVDCPWMQDESMREKAYQLTGLENIRPPPKVLEAAAPAALAPGRRVANGPRGLLEYYPKPTASPAAPAARGATPPAKAAKAAVRKPAPARATAPAPPQRNAANMRRATLQPPSPIPAGGGAPVASPLHSPAAVLAAEAAAAARAATPAPAKVRGAVTPARTPAANARGAVGGVAGAAPRGLSPYPSPPVATPAHARAQKTFLLDARRQLKPVDRNV